MLPSEVIATSKALYIGQDQGSALKLRNYILETDRSAIQKHYEQLLGQPEAEEFLNAICTGTRPGLLETEAGSDLGKCASVRLATFQTTISLFSSTDPPCTPQEAEKLIAILNENFSAFDGAGDLSIIVEAALEAFESDTPLAAQALNILPPILAALQNLGGGYAADDGASVNIFQGVVSRICEHPWPTSSIAAILESLRDFPMTLQTLDAAVRRGAARARAANVVDLPAVVHQLLVLAGPACRDLALTEIVRLFDRLDAAATASLVINQNSDTAASKHRQLLEIEGSVLLSLDSIIKHDPDIARLWLKRLKDGSWRPTPFAFALSLVIAGIEKLEQQVIAALNACILKASKDAGKRAAASWLPEESSSARSSDVQVVIEEALITCARNAGHCQAVIQPLVALAVSLLESEASIGAKQGFQKDKEASTAGNLGIRVLVEIFAAHKECRRDVVSLASGRLPGASDASAAPYIRLISELVKKYPALVETQLPEVRSALENLSALPPAAAISLLLALWPLARSRKDIADFMVVLLRKAMFSRDLGSRLLAARGFLFIITEELKTANANNEENPTNEDSNQAGGSTGGLGRSCSQGSGAAMSALSQMDALIGGPTGANLLHELMGFLRRCLAQQPEVRAAVYDGLPGLLVVDPAAAEAVAELLLPHVASFYENADNLAPLKLEACARIGPDHEVRVIEPLHRLLACVRCVLRSDPSAPSLSLDSEDEEEEDEASQNNFANQSASPALRRLFSSLRKRLASTPLEDFNFDQSTNFAASDPHGILNQAYANMLLGCYEVMMEDVVYDIDGAGGAPPGPENSEKLGDELIELFSQHRRLSNLAAEGMKGSGGKNKRIEGLTQAVGGRGNTSKAQNNSSSSINAVLGPLDHRPPALTVHCLSRLLEATVSDGLIPHGHQRSDGSTSSHVKFARDVNAMTFIMTSSLRLLQSCQQSALGFESLPALVLDNNASPEVVKALFGFPDWRALSIPLYRASQMTIQAICNETVPAAAGGVKKEKENLMQASVTALDQLLVCSGGTLEGLAEILKNVELPSSQVAAAAALPPVSSSAAADSPLAILSARLPHFKNLFDSLVIKAFAKEILSLVRCLNTLVAVVPRKWAATMAKWVDNACARAHTTLSHNMPTAKAILALQLRCHCASGHNGDAKILNKLAQDMQQCIDDTDAGAADALANSTIAFSALESNPLLSSTTINGIMQVACAHIDAALVPLDWVLGKLKPTAVDSGIANEAIDGGVGGAEVVAGAVGAFVQGQMQVMWEYNTFNRISSLCTAVAGLTRVQMDSAGEILARTLTKLYKTLSLAAKTQIAARGQTQLPPGKPFQDLAAAVNGDLTPAVYGLKTELQQTNRELEKKDVDTEEEEEEEENEGGNRVKSRTAKKAAAMRRLQKDAKVLPALVYQVEEWEKHLIKVGKLGKINLMLNAKRATNWDFRIGAPEKKRRLSSEQEQVRTEEREENEEEEGGEVDDENEVMEDDEMGEGEEEDDGGAGIYDVEASEDE